MSNFHVWLASACCLLSAACADRGPIVATAAIAASRDRVPIAGSVDLTLQFHVLPEARRLPSGGRVLLRLLFDDGELMKNDDHDPPQAMNDWKPGSTIQYTRPIALPDVPYVGDVYIAVGLASPSNDRLRLVVPADADLGGRLYRLAKLVVVAPPPQE